MLLKDLYKTLAPMLFMVSLLLFYVAAGQFLGQRKAGQTFAQTNVVRSFFSAFSSKARPSDLSRVPIVEHRGDHYHILAIAVSPAPKDRKVLVRDVETGEIAAFKVGERMFGRGPKVNHITPGSVQFTAETTHKRTIRLDEPLR